MRQFVAFGGIHRPETQQQRLIAFIIRWLITAVAVWAAAKLIDGIHLDGWKSTLVVALVLGLLNAYLKPLLTIGTILFVVLTAGLFLIIINTILLALTAWFLGRFDSIQFRIDGFWDAFFGAVIISIVSFVLTRFIDPRKMARKFG